MRRVLACPARRASAAVRLRPPVLQQTEAAANGIVCFDALHHAAPGPDEAVSLLHGMGQALAPGGGTCWSL